MGYNPRFPILLKLGLSEGECEVFELLVKDGTQKARELVQKTSLGRGNVYNLLNALIAKGLVLEISGAQNSYQAVDPSHLKTLLDKKKEETRRLEMEFSDSLGSLSSLFTLSTGKPSIEYFEGEKGVEEATFDTLNAKGEILTIIDGDASEKYTHEFNKRYIPARLKRQIQKRLIAFNTTTSRDMLVKEINTYTKYRFVEESPTTLDTMIQIYNDSVGLLTMGEKPVGVIIRDQKIARTLRATFEALWKQLPDPTPPSAPTSTAPPLTV